MKRLLISVIVFLVGFGVAVYNEYHEMEYVLNTNTSYEWDTVKNCECSSDDTFDHYIVMESSGKEFKVHFYYEDGKLVETSIVAQNGHVGELDVVATELNEIFDNAFWYVW